MTGRRGDRLPRRWWSGAASTEDGGAERRPLLMVTPYPPYRDGIGAYAVQEVRRLRASGTPVEVLSPLPSAAHHHLSLGGVRGIAALARFGGAYDAVLIQFSPEMLFGACRSPAQRVAVWGGLLALAGRTKLEIRLHEIEYGPLERNPMERAAAVRALAAAERITVHSEVEADDLVDRVGLDRGSITVVDHGAAFAPFSDADRAEARADLGLDPDEHVFLAIGFLQEHKGFDLAVEAFGRANLHDHASLHVVGSVRVEHPDLVAYARRLRLLCQATEGASLHERYVSDDEFDRWIAASDTVVLPYREIWSSGVLERAKLLGRPVIATDVGGIGHQAPEGTIFFSDIETLVQAMKERSVATLAERSDRAGGADLDGRRSARARDRRPRWVIDADSPDRRSIEEQVRERIRRRHLDESGSRTAGPVRAGSSVDPLLTLGPVGRPHAVSARPGVSQLKRFIRRVINWEIAPLASRLDEVQRATVDSIVDLEERLGALEASGRDEADRPDNTD